MNPQPIAALSLCLAACGESVLPGADRTALDSTLDVPADTRDADRLDAITDASIPADEALADAARDDASIDDADGAIDESLRPPFSRVVFVDTSLLRDTADLERVEASRVSPHGRGAWSRVRSGSCFVETRIQRTYTPFADSLEVRQLSPEQAPFMAERATDERLVWRTDSNIFSEGDRLRITANRSDWPAPWTVELTTPVVALVSSPSWRVQLVSYRDPLQFRWQSTRVSPAAVVRITFQRSVSAGTAGVSDTWELQCDVEPWREQATITLADHPLFPLRPGIDRSLVIRVDTLLVQREALPNGEPVIIETRSNARSIAPNLTP